MDSKSGKQRKKTLQPINIKKNENFFTFHVATLKKDKITEHNTSKGFRVLFKKIKELYPNKLKKYRIRGIAY